MSHKAHEGYSGKNPVPKVALKSLFNNRAATESKARALGAANKGNDDKSNLPDSILKGAEVQVKVRISFFKRTIRPRNSESGSSNR